MKYEQYKQAYEALVLKLLDSSRYGASKLCSELADLEENFPEHAKQYDEELDSELDGTVTWSMTI